MMGYVLRRMKNQKKYFPIFSFSDTVDFKCEKYDQNHFFRSISMNFFWYESDDLKKFTFWKKKDVEIFYWNAVECKPVPTRVLNPKACGVQERNPGWGCRGAKPLATKRKRKKCWHFFIEVFFFLEVKIFFLKFVWFVPKFIFIEIGRN